MKSAQVDVESWLIYQELCCLRHAITIKLGFAILDEEIYPCTQVFIEHLMYASPYFMQQNLDPLFLWLITQQMKINSKQLKYINRHINL